MIANSRPALTIRSLLDSVLVRRFLNGMPVRSQDNPALFIHIPKCAGTSVRTGLGLDRLASARDVMDFYHASFPVSIGHLNIQDLIDSKILTRWSVSQSFVFTFVRNPFHRAVSLFHYMRRVGLVAGQGESLRRDGGWKSAFSARDEPAWFVGFLQRLTEGIPRVGLYSNQGLSQCNPQADWIPLDLPVFVGRVENFEHDFTEVAGRIRGEVLPVERLNAGEPSLTRSELFTAEAVSIILEFYGEDFQRFGYSTTWSSLAEQGNPSRWSSS